MLVHIGFAVYSLNLPTLGKTKDVNSTDNLSNVVDGFLARSGIYFSRFIVTSLYLRNV